MRKTHSAIEALWGATFWERVTLQKQHSVKATLKERFYDIWTFYDKETICERDEILKTVYFFNVVVVFLKSFTHINELNLTPGCHLIMDHR